MKNIYIYANHAKIVLSRAALTNYMLLFCLTTKCNGLNSIVIFISLNYIPIGNIYVIIGRVMHNTM